MLVLCVFLVGCAGIKREEAKELAESFLGAVESGDFADAESYLHPDRRMNLAAYFDGIEAREQINLQNGIQINRNIEYSFSGYEREVDGSECELEMTVLVDGVAFELQLTIVKNDRGYGIYQIEFEK